MAEKKVESFKMDAAVKPIFDRLAEPVQEKVRGMYTGDVAAAALLAYAGIPFDLQVQLLREYRDREPLEQAGADTALLRKLGDILEEGLKHPTVRRQTRKAKAR